MAPSQDEQQRITALVARFEADTGIQAVAAVTDKADAYPDIPWKAYAMGSALGALAAAFNPFFVSGWSHGSVIALDAMLILTGGATLAMLAAFVPLVGRLFLDRVRAQGEAIQYAQGLFLERELFRTRNRRAVLIVVSRFERIAVVVADTGLRNYAPASTVIPSSRRTPGLNDLVGAFDTAFLDLKELLLRGGFTAAPAEQNEIADEIVVEKRV
jgi:putative membrane protein